MFFEYNPLSFSILLKSIYPEICLFKSVIIWGGISFLWQVIAEIILPRIFILELGSEGYGQLSFFLSPLNPVFWFDFTGDINKGLLVVLPDLDIKSQKTIPEKNILQL